MPVNVILLMLVETTRRAETHRSQPLSTVSPLDESNRGDVVTQRAADDERVEDLVIAERRRPGVRAVQGIHDRAGRVEQAADDDEREIGPRERVDERAELG